MALTPTRSATAATWTASTVILANGEVVIASDTGVVKVGDGINLWSALPVAEVKETSAAAILDVSDATGTGAQVFATSPTLTTPTITASVANAVSASATQTQAAGTALTKDINVVTVVGTAGDAVTLPAATAGKQMIVDNAHATNALGIFPATGDAINAIAANGVYSLAATKGVLFFCTLAGVWRTILSA